MSYTIVVSIVLAVVMGEPSFARDHKAQAPSKFDQSDPLSSDPSDPGNLLRETQKKDAWWQQRAADDQVQPKKQKR